MYIGILIVLGLCMGSFIDALVWRIHEQAKPKANRAKVNVSMTTGRSVCPRCEHVLGPLDLVPLFSWLVLRGRCRYCKQTIGWQPPVIEVLTAGLFVLSYVVWPYGLDAAGVFQFITWLACLTSLIALAVYDLKWMLLPNRLVFVVIALAAVQVVGLSVWQANPLLIAGALWGVIGLAGLFYILFQVSAGKWIGGGDVKLGIALGILVGGPLNSLLVLFLASLLGTICAVPLLKTGKTALARRLPFGPFLIIATLIVYLCGTALTTWYKRQFLLL